MKKFIFSIMALFATVSLSAADNLTLGDVTVAQGKSALLPINITSVERSYRGFQFLLTLPDGFTVTDVVNAADRTSDVFTLDFKEQSTKGVYQILVYNTKNQYFTGTEGAVAYINITAAEDQAVGEYTGKVSSVVMSTDQSWYFDESEFKITVTDRIVLEETSTELPTEIENVNVTVKRTIKANEWGTICLPFAMTQEQAFAAFGSDAEFGYFADYEVDGGEGSVSKTQIFDASSITINFDKEDLSAGFDANIPYLIKVTKDIEFFNVDGVTIEPDEENALIEYNNGKNGSKKEVYGNFYGTLHAGISIPENGLFLSGGNFWYSKGLTKIKAFRGYFVLNNILTDLSSGSVKVNIDGEATSIDGMHIQYATDGVYDLSGRKIQLENGDLNKLQKGVYIIDGKKVTIK